MVRVRVCVCGCFSYGLREKIGGNWFGRTSTTSARVERRAWFYSFRDFHISFFLSWKYVLGFFLGLLLLLASPPLPPFSLFSHLVVVLVSGMTVSRRLGRRRHARAFSRSLFIFHFLFSFFPPSGRHLLDLLSCMMTAVCIFFFLFFLLVLFFFFVQWL